MDLNQKKNELETILQETKAETEALMLRSADLEKHIDERLYGFFFIGAIGGYGHFCAGHNCHGKDAQETFCVNFAFLRFNPDAGMEIVCLLDEVSSLLVVQSGCAFYYGSHMEHVVTS